MAGFRARSGTILNPSLKFMRLHSQISPERRHRQSFVHSTSSSEERTDKSTNSKTILKDASDVDLNKKEINRKEYELLMKKQTLEHQESILKKSTTQHALFNNLLECKTQEEQIQKEKEQLKELELK